DVCQTVGGAELVRAACPVDAPKNNLRVEGYTPPPAIVDQVECIMRAAHIDVGGVEYMIDDRDGRLYFYDINALSNFVADAPRVVGRRGAPVWGRVRPARRALRPHRRMARGGERHVGRAAVQLRGAVLHGRAGDPRAEARGAAAPDAVRRG